MASQGVAKGPPAAVVHDIRALERNLNSAAPKSCSIDYGDADSGTHLMTRKSIHDAEDRKKPRVMEDGWLWVRKWFGLRNQISRELIAEFFGTLFLVLIGEAAYGVQVLSRGKDGNSATTNLSWGFGVFFATLLTLQISGALLNPAITLAFALIGKVSLRKVIPFCVVQTVGAFCGAALVYLVYYDAINAFDGGFRQIYGPNGTAHIFATYPKSHIEATHNLAAYQYSYPTHIETRLSTEGAFFDQLMGTFVLVIGAVAAHDRYNGLPKNLIPFAMAFIYMVVGLAFMYNAGGAINPARDFGPRIFTSICGYGVEVFAFRDHNWFWIPIVGPLIGGLLGGFAYKMLFGIHHPDVIATDDMAKRTWHSTKAIVLRNDDIDAEKAHPEEMNRIR